MSAYEICKNQIVKEPKTWLITGVAGFIGSNLLERLLLLNQRVIGLDNFSTGHQRNLDDVKSLVSPEQWSRFKFIEGDIRNLDDCYKACNGIDYVLHEAALGSVPRSIENPIATNETNISGFLNMLEAAKNTGIKRFVYAASSSSYGDHPELPKVEEKIGRPLSPYAVTKYVNELYADVFGRAYGFSSIGLRYFNVFGKRQDPNGAYAAVIPKWIVTMIQGGAIFINGDGQTSRDFCYIENAVEANLLAAITMPSVENRCEIYNVARGESTSLIQLYEYIKKILNLNNIYYEREPNFRAFREGDIKQSLANINKAIKRLGYDPKYKIEEGLRHCVYWYINKYK